MDEERLYRLLFPGAVFLFFFLGWLIADPNISLTIILSQRPADGGALMYTFTLGGALIILSIGFLVGEITFKMGCLDANIGLCETQTRHREDAVRPVAIPAADDPLTSISIFTHTIFAQKYPELHRHVGRLWSRVILARTSAVAIIAATAAYSWLGYALHVHSQCEMGGQSPMARLIQALITVFAPGSIRHAYSWYLPDSNILYRERIGCYLALCVMFIIVLLCSAKKANAMRVKTYRAILAIPQPIEKKPTVSLWL